MLTHPPIDPPPHVTQTHSMSHNIIPCHTPHYMPHTPLHILHPITCHKVGILHKTQVFPHGTHTHSMSHSPPITFCHTAPFCHPFLSHNPLSHRICHRAHAPTPSPASSSSSLFSCLFFFFSLTPVRASSPFPSPQLVGSTNSSPSRFVFGEREGESSHTLCTLDVPSASLLARRAEALVRLRKSWHVEWQRSNELCALLCGAERLAMPLECREARTSAAAAARTAVRAVAETTTGGGGHVATAIAKAEALRADALGAIAAEHSSSSNSPKSANSPNVRVQSSHAIVSSTTGVTHSPPPPPLPTPPPPPPAARAAAAAAPTDAPQQLAAAAALTRDDSSSGLASSNVAQLAALSQMEVVRFHLSGTEALIAAARLVRTNTGRPLLATFGSAAHGWTDGMAAEGVSLGEERYACDVINLRDMSAATLTLIRMRRDEIAAVLVNPIQGLATPPRERVPPPTVGGVPPPTVGGVPPPTADSAMHSSVASSAAVAPPPVPDATFETDYVLWLRELRAVCTREDVPLIFDESATGFRVARSGAQEYFGVWADVVCYGKERHNDGMPLGAICGSQKLLLESAPRLPLICPAGGRNAAEDLTLMRHAAAFLERATSRTAEQYAAAHDEGQRWANSLNAALAAEWLPIKLVFEASVYSIKFEEPGRYHWLLQYYLREEGMMPVWLAPGRIGFAFDPASDSRAIAVHLGAMEAPVLHAARRMREDGWWMDPQQDARVQLCTDSQLRIQISKEVASALLCRLTVAATNLLPNSWQRALRKQHARY